MCIENLSVADRVNWLVVQHRNIRKDNRLDRTTIGQEFDVAK